jgi:hypothetical protein
MLYLLVYLFLIAIKCLEVALKSLTCLNIIKHELVGIVMRKW